MRSAQTNRHVPPCAVSETSQTARELSAPVGGRALGLRSEYGWLAAELVCAGLEPGAVERRVYADGLMPVQPSCPRCAPPSPRPRAPHAPRRARARTRPARPRAPWAILLPHLTTPVCPESRRSRRELSNKVLYVIGTWFFALKWRCRGQNFLPGLRPGPRGRTGPLAGYGVCWGVPQRRCMGASAPAGARAGVRAAAGGGGREGGGGSARGWRCWGSSLPRTRWSCCP